MRIKKGYQLVSENNGYNYIASANRQFDHPVVLSKIGTFLWQATEKEDLSATQLLEKLLDNFQISTVLALGEIDNFVKICKENGIFE